jgi:hypothetical protein
MSYLRNCKPIFLLLLGLFMGLSATASTAIGRMALVVGEVKRTDAQGRTDSLRMGATIAQGDRIITGIDSIAMIIFVDDARLSLRSDSELLIKQYHIDTAGQDHQLNFQLLRGAMRQISGKAATQQPERYRLNTPIASIGVRGTDFLAKTTSNELETFIQEGKIVLLSNNERCQTSGHGTACAPLAQLAATDTERYLKILSNGNMEFRNVPADEIKRTFGISITKAPAAPASNEVVAGSNVKVYTKLADNEDTGSTSQQLASIENKILDTKNQAHSNSANNPLPETMAALEPDLNRQLVWGRYTIINTDTLPYTMLAPYAKAVEGRDVTVGQVLEYGLFRSGKNISFTNTHKGEVKFNLHAAEAFFTNAQQTLVARVSQPTLSINFDHSSFYTQFTLSQAQIGSTTLSTSGRVSDEGLFTSNEPGQMVAGAVTSDAQEAGLLFSKDYADGAFKGVTLWNAR